MDDLIIPVLVSLVSSTLALTFGLISLFRYQFDRWFYGEFIKVEFPPGHFQIQYTYSDDCIEGLHPCIIARLLVKNTGSIAAEDVRFFLTERLVKNEKSDEWIKDDLFVPIHLKWMHTSQEMKIIPPKASYYCDLGILIPPNYTPKHYNPLYQDNRFPSKNNSFILYTEKLPANNSSFLDPGEYILQYEIFTKRGRRGSGKIFIAFENEWKKIDNPNKLLYVDVKRTNKPEGRRILQFDK